MITAAALAVQVVLWHAYRAGEEIALEQCVAAYNQRQSDVHVEAVAVPFDAYSTKLEAAIPRGNGPDLFIASHEGIGEWQRSSLIVPYPRDLDLTQFLDGTVAPLTSDGRTYGLPLAFKSLALFYRRDLMPSAPRTTDEWIALAQSGRYPLAYEAGSFFYHAAFLHGFGGQIFDTGGKPQLATPESTAALAFVRSLADRHLIPDESTSVVAAQLFNDGRALTTINGPWFVGEIAPGVRYGVAPLPIVSATGRRAAPLLTVEAVLLANRARHPEAALAFARYLAGPEAALVRALVGHQTVAERSAWDDPRVSGDPVLAAFRAQLADTVPMSNRPEMKAIWEPAQAALRTVLRGAADPKSALSDAQRRIEIILRPAPPAASKLPYALLLCALGVVGGALLLRRPHTHSILSVVSRRSYAYAFLAPAAAAMIVLVFVPFAVGAGMSLFHYSAGQNGGSWTFIGLSNFGDILGSRDAPITDPLSFYFTLLITALWTLCNVALHVAIGVTLALLLRDPLLRLRGVYRVLLIVPWAVPNYITALIWKGMFHRQFGAVNALLGALGLAPVAWFSRFWTAFSANVVTNVWLGFPFMMVVTLGALSRVPKEVEEAAALDGATAWQRLRYVVLPLIRPALLPSVLLGAVWTFNMFNIVFLVSGGEPDGMTEILVSQAYRWAFTRGHRYGYAAAYAVLIFLVLLLQSIVSRRAAEPAEGMAT